MKQIDEYPAFSYLFEDIFRVVSVIRPKKISEKDPHPAVRVTYLLKDGTHDYVFIPIEVWDASVKDLIDLRSKVVDAYKEES